MPKLTDTQNLILTRAANRPDNLAMPLPEGLHGAAAKMSVSNMIAQGWLEELDADMRKGEPLWRETGEPTPHLRRGRPLYLGHECRREGSSSHGVSEH